MRVMIFGATGMLGQGVLRECLRDPDVEQVLAVGRGPSGQTSPKLRDLVLPDLFRIADAAAELAGYDACLYCLGVSSAGMSEAAYARVTYDLTVVVAEAVMRASSGLTFVFVSGAGTDATEKGRTMWARVKGRAENAVLRMPFRAAYVFRPGFVEPMHGITSRTRSYRVLGAIMKPLYPLLRRAPAIATTTERLGRAMLAVARQGYAKQVLESADINVVGR